MTSQEQALLDVLRRVFTDHRISIPLIRMETKYCPELVAAFEAVIPNVRYQRSKYVLRERLLLDFFPAWAKQHLMVTDYPWDWCIKDSASSCSKTLGYLLGQA
jgi:hypothetical protein